MSEFFHSVTLDRDLCRGCINCVKRCPTEAIRVRDGKAKILSDRCIDCGECIRICPYHAKKPIVDPLSVMDQYEYTVALPAPSLYGQFNNLDDVEIILRALIDMGFDDIFEVSRAAELVSDATRKMLSEGQLPRPVISSACPAVVRLIRVRFPDLIRHPAATGPGRGGRTAGEKRGDGTYRPSRRKDRMYLYLSLCRQSHGG